MRLLFCCEYYHPSRGGVQEVMRQIAERMVQAGHDVTVATTPVPERESLVIGGVRIEEFDIRGNPVLGLEGGKEIERYQEFLVTFPGDALMIKAAQQWTFDASWPVLDRIKARKVFIPCGFSGLYLPEYASYFQELPEVLRKWDHLIFYAERYRDIDFAREHGLSDFTVLPNGASDIEFAVPPDLEFRARMGVAEDAFLILTVGTPIYAKGHGELAEAFALLKGGEDRPLALILNGQWPRPAPAPCAAFASEPLPPPVSLIGRLHGFGRRAAEFWAREGTRAFAQRALMAVRYRILGALRYLLALPLRQIAPGANELASRTGLPASERFASALAAAKRSEFARRPIEHWIDEAARQPGKQVLKTHMSREDTVQAFMAADLFVFASHVEYSPLVLYEAAASGTPFLSVPVGNSDEIVRWTGGGQLCPAERDGRGYTRVDPAVLAAEIERMMADPELLRRLGAAGREAWRTTYNWSAIARRYEAILAGADHQG